MGTFKQDIAMWDEEPVNVASDANFIWRIEWYKDEAPRGRVRSAIETVLNELPPRYDKECFDAKTYLLLNHFIDMAIQGYEWIAA